MLPVHFVGQTCPSGLSGTWSSQAKTQEQSGDANFTNRTIWHIDAHQNRREHSCWSVFVHSHLGLPHLLFVDRILHVCVCVCRCVHVCEVTEPFDLSKNRPPLLTVFLSAAVAAALLSATEFTAVYWSLHRPPAASWHAQLQPRAVRSIWLRGSMAIYGSLLNNVGHPRLSATGLSGSVQLIQLHLSRDIVHPPPHAFESVCEHLCTTAYCTPYNIQHLPPVESVARCSGCQFRPVTPLVTLSAVSYH